MTPRGVTFATVTAGIWADYTPNDSTTASLRGREMQYRVGARGQLHRHPVSRSWSVERAGNHALRLLEGIECREIVAGERLASQNASWRCLTPIQNDFPFRIK